MTLNKEKLNIAVLGMGFWGTALAQYISGLGHHVLGWSNKLEIVDSINSNGKNSNCFINTNLNFTATLDLNSVLSYPIIVVAIPTKALNQYSELLKLNSEQTLISVMKGFDPKSGKTPILSLLDNGLKCSSATLSGPSFAIDVMNKTPVALSCASKDSKVSQFIASIFHSDKMRVYPTTDLIGVELGGALKNIIAVAAGVAAGLKLGDSTKAALLTRGLAEMTRYATYFGAKPETLYGLSGLGDLVLTTSSTTSRNYSFGVRLGHGVEVLDALNEVGSIAEGYFSTPIIAKNASNLGIDMPITYNLALLLSGSIKATELVEILMSRPAVSLS